MSKTTSAGLQRNYEAAVRELDVLLTKTESVSAPKRKKQLELAVRAQQARVKKIRLAIQVLQ
jgi:hypothetical protein